MIIHWEGTPTGVCVRKDGGAEQTSKDFSGTTRGTTKRVQIVTCLVCSSYYNTLDKPMLLELTQTEIVQLIKCIETAAIVEASVFNTALPLRDKLQKIVDAWKIAETENAAKKIVGQKQRSS
jgi:hypothetical protein